MDITNMISAANSKIYSGFLSYSLLSMTKLKSSAFNISRAILETITKTADKTM